MGNGNFRVHAADNDRSAGELMCSCPGGLPGRADTRHERQFTARSARMHIFISAALDGTARIVSVQRPH
jgi:hypothetical protein